MVSKDHGELFALFFGSIVFYTTSRNLDVCISFPEAVQKFDFLQVKKKTFENLIRVLHLTVR